MPKNIQDNLGVGRPGIDGIADRGENFNATDVVNDSLPMRRFVVAGISNDAVLTAIERGGIGYSVEVSLFENINQQPVEKETYTLFEAPKTLTELAQRIEPSTR